MAIEPNYTQIAEEIRSDLELLDPLSLSELFEIVLKINQIFPSGDDKPHKPYKGFEDLKKKREEFVENLIPNLFREMATDFCEVLEISKKDFFVKGGGASGKPAISPVPWVMFSDKRISDGATKGRYCVYLFGYAGKSMYLSLNQTTSYKGLWDSKGKEKIDDEDLEITARWARSIALTSEHNGLGNFKTKLTDDINLKIPKPGEGPGSRSRARSYEPGSALAVEYRKDAVPDFRELKEDALVFSYLLKDVYAQMDKGLDPLDLLLGIDHTDRSKENVSPGGTRRETLKATPIDGVPYHWATEDQAIEGSGEMNRDPEKVERGLKAHAEIQNLVAQWVIDNGLEPKSPSSRSANYDLGWYDGQGIFHVCEVKSLTAGNEEHQLRIGLGQVLRYRQKCGHGTIAVLAIERAPSDNSWLALCEEFNVKVVWPGHLEPLQGGSA